MVKLASGGIERCLGTGAFPVDLDPGKSHVDAEEATRRADLCPTSHPVWPLKPDRHRACMTGSVAVNAMVAACLSVPILVGSGPSADEILSAMAKNTAARHAAIYSGWRQYSIQNLRFGKSASATVRITSRPGAGKQLTIVKSSGSTSLIRVVETLLSSEVDASKSRKERDHEISPSNYGSSIQGSEVVAGHDCWILRLMPRTKNKYLVNGTAWVDKGSNALVRLDGTTAASVSMWVGTPHLIEDFAPVGGIWLPAHTMSKSTSVLLGESDLEIRYLDYEVKSVPGKTAEVFRRARP